MINIIYLVGFIAGIGVGVIGKIPQQCIPIALISYILYPLIFFVGIGIGTNLKIWRVIVQFHWRILLIPIGVMIGSFFGVAIVSILFSDISIKQALAVGAGFGYYSLSSVVISQMDGPVLGVIALISNLTREILTLLFAPVMVLVFGKFAPIFSGGATAMDTTLPVITRSPGEEYAILAVFSGMVLTFLVPILVPIFL